MLAVCANCASEPIITIEEATGRIALVEVAEYLKLQC